MTRVQKAVFPGFIVGCLFLVLFASLAASPHTAMASAQPQAPTPQAGEEGEPPVEDASAASIAVPASVEEISPDLAPQPEEQAGGDWGCMISPGYPESIQQWCEDITRNAQQHGLDPNLIAAVMLQESAGNPNAYSKSGAVGLMQVMPRDGLAAGFMCINGPCFASRPSSEELYNPQFNIEYGTRMLAGLINRHGNIRDGLKSYGPMNVGYYYADIVMGIFNRY